jgi:hypothetical protein
VLDDALHRRRGLDAVPVESGAVAGAGGWDIRSTIRGKAMVARFDIGV